MILSTETSPHTRYLELENELADGAKSSPTLKKLKKHTEEIAQSRVNSLSEIC